MLVHLGMNKNNETPVGAFLHWLLKVLCLNFYNHTKPLSWLFLYDQRSRLKTLILLRLYHITRGVLRARSPPFLTTY